MNEELNFEQSQIYKEILNNNLTHSIMLVSQDKQLLDVYANLIAKTIFCQNPNKPCGVCSNCQKIEHKNMVDLLFYPKETDVLKSAELNNMLDTVFELPFENEKKVYVLNNFSSTDALIQNKLLKTLEEPPKHAYFILKVDNETQVLQTIKSRCQKIMLPKLNTNALNSFLKDADKTLVDEAVAFCDGSLELAKQYINNPNFKSNVDFVFDLLKNYKKSWQMVDYASKLYNKKDEILDIVHIYLKILQDTTYLVLGVDDLITLNTHQADLAAVGANFSLDAMTQMIKYTNVLIEKLDRNCNFGTIVDEFLLEILEVKHKWPIS